MKCNKCPKKATVHLTEIVDGKVMEMHLCEDCARDQSAQMEQQFGLGDLLAGMTDFGKHVPQMKQESLHCLSCGLAYEEFRKVGRFGCAQCYITFRPHLKTLFKKIHGSSAHLGKKPEKFIDLDPPKSVAPVAPAAPGVQVVAEPKVDTIDSLRIKMLKAIEQENFELAAQLRDRIREMEQGGG